MLSTGLDNIVRRFWLQRFLHQGNSVIFNYKLLFKQTGPFFLFLVLLNYFLIPQSSLANQNSDSDQPLKKATIVWGQELSSSLELFYTTFSNGAWSKPKQLTFSGTLNYTPTLITDNYNNTWVVWSSLEHSGIQLNYAILNGNIVIQQPKRIITRLKSNVGPFIAIHKNVPTLVWAGNNGDNDDIYLSKFKGNKWITPQRIHPTNSTPDYLPRLIIDENDTISVEWVTIGPKGQNILIKTMDSKTFKKKSISLLTRNTRKKRTHLLRKCLNNLPENGLNYQLSSMALTCDGLDKPTQVRNLKKYLSH